MKIQRTSAWLMAFAIIALISFQVRPAFAANHSLQSAQLVEKARLTLQSFMCDEKMGAFRDLLHHARGVLIFPQVLKGGFIIGAFGSSGNGVLLVHDMETDQWTGPAFYTVAGASFGFQFGAEVSEAVVLVMSERGINSLMSNAVKLGADIGVAAGPVGVGASASTANLSADLLSFARSKGLYGGVSLDGSVVAVRKRLNEAFYRRPISPTEIFSGAPSANPYARELLEEVASSTSPDFSAARVCYEVPEPGKPPRG